MDRAAMDRYFNNPPPESVPDVAPKILRVPAQGMGGVIVQSDDILGVYLHFWGGRTVPCDRSPECRACRADNPLKYRGYIAVQNRDGTVRGILEVTPNVVEYLRRIRAAKGTLRGQAIALYRTPKRARGRMYCESLPFAVAPKEVGPAPDVREVLLAAWQVYLMKENRPKKPKGDAADNGRTDAPRGAPAEEGGSAK